MYVDKLNIFGTNRIYLKLWRGQAPKKVKTSLVYIIFPTTKGLIFRFQIPSQLDLCLDDQALTTLRRHPQTTLLSKIKL